MEAIGVGISAIRYDDGRTYINTRGGLKGRGGAGK